MPSITLKDVPRALLDRLRERARLDRRSLQQEVLHLLEGALEARAVSPEEVARLQTEAWAALAGKFRHEGDVDALVREIRRARTRGRKVDL